MEGAAACVAMSSCRSKSTAPRDQHRRDARVGHRRTGNAGADCSYQRSSARLIRATSLFAARDSWYRGRAPPADRRPASSSRRRLFFFFSSFRRFEHYLFAAYARRWPIVGAASAAAKLRHALTTTAAHQFVRWSSGRALTRGRLVRWRLVSR